MQTRLTTGAGRKGPDLYYQRAPSGGRGMFGRKRLGEALGCMGKLMTLDTGALNALH